MILLFGVAYIVVGSYVLGPCFCCVVLGIISIVEGAQWLSGRVLDSRPRGCGFEPHRRHCVVSLSKTHLSLLSTGSTQEDPSRLTETLLAGT